jgi:predicted RNase H-like HicB family nuclease
LGSSVNGGKPAVPARLGLRGSQKREYAMNNEYTAVIKQDGGWWIGWIEEVPGVNCQEGNRQELVESLTVTLREALDFNGEEALSAAGDGYTEERIAL